MINNAKYLVKTTPIPINVVSTGGMRLKVRPQGSQIYVGNHTVDTTSGFEIQSGQSEDFTVPAGEQLYAVSTSSSGVNVIVIRTQSGG